MDCQTFTIKHGLVRCPHWDECHRLGVCLCEIDPDAEQSPPPPKRKRADKLPWPQRRQQVLQLAAKRGTITTATLMEDTNAQHGTVSRWLQKLTKEGVIKCQTPANPGRYNHRPAVYQIALSSAPAESSG